MKIFCFFIGFKPTTESTPKEVVQAVVNNYKNQKSVSYSINYKNKSFFSEDTNSVFADCIIIRGINNSTSNSILWYKTNKGIERFYQSMEV